MLEDTYLDKIRIAEMKFTFEWMSKDNKKGKKPMVYILNPLIHLIASYLLFTPTKRKKREEVEEITEALKFRKIS